MNQPIYVSPRGLQTLQTIRIGAPSVPAVQGWPSAVLLASVPSDECGCPEEIWQVDNIEILIHFESDGSSDMIVYTGDDEFEFTFDNCRNIHNLRAKMFETFGNMVEG